LRQRAWIRFYLHKEMKDFKTLDEFAEAWVGLIYVLQQTGVMEK
jgi:hypothetical protein